MDLEQMRDNMKVRLSKSRYLHSTGVEEVACDLAVIFGYDEEKASIAGILHDCARNLTDPELLKQCEVFHLQVSEIEHECPFLLHAKVGAAYAKEEFGVEDEEIISAIIYHTTGRPAMTLLEKIIFTADYIEPYRKPLPRIESIRDAAYSNLDLGVMMILENTLDYLNSSGAEIDTLTVDTYEYYKAQLLLGSKSIK